MAAAVRLQDQYLVGAVPGGGNGGAVAGARNRELSGCAGGPDQSREIIAVGVTRPAWRRAWLPNSMTGRYGWYSDRRPCNSLFHYRGCPFPRAPFLPGG